MMRGTTMRRQATLPITLRLPGQPDFTIEFVVDTGFSEDLTLPVAAVAAMGLPLLFRRSVGLADGSAVTMAIHSAKILWDGVERQVSVLATGRRPLLGTMLLDEQELRVRFHEGDLVSVEDL
jgi:clan AA aspartic protease